MTNRAPKIFEVTTIEGLTIDDEASFRHVGLYVDLAEILKRAKYPFRILSGAASGRWDRALFLNLTFWGASVGGDVLVDRHLGADVVAHVAWHHLAAAALAPAAGATPTAEALFLGEAVASAFDVYLVGRLLGHAPESSFLETQVAAMADAAQSAGLSEADFEQLLQDIAADPERAFEDLRALLFDATTALLACANADEAAVVLTRLDAHRFAPLLHHYELSNWILYVRAYCPGALAPDPSVRAIDRALREADVAVDWLAREWIAPRL